MTPLDEAEGLLRSAKQPCQLRTAISRAYYATFQRLVGVCTPLGFTQNARPLPGAPHKGVHLRLRIFTMDSQVAVLRKIGTSRLPDLYALRIKADYAFAASVRRYEAEDAVACAIEIEDWLTDAAL